MPNDTSVVSGLDARNGLLGELIDELLPSSVAGKKPKKRPLLNELSCDIELVGSSKRKSFITRAVLIDWEPSFASKAREPVCQEDSDRTQVEL